MLTNDHKRILRNTGMLYVRMFLAMVVGLYTSRVALTELGVEDFGVYHAVAGFVALLGFMQGAMTTATQRYFAYDLGESKGSNLRNLYNTSLQIHILLVLCIVLLAETIGYWFVSTKLTIPEGRLDAAIWAYHLSIATFAVQVMTQPLIAMLTAHERMGIFALMSIADVLLKLAAVLLLPHLFYDKLTAYAILLLGVSLLTFSGHLLIIRATFPAARMKWRWHAARFRSMLSFTAWNTWGNLAAALSVHGNNLLLNIFFGPAVNAGRNIASQANGALNNFVLNVQAAISPQIFKQYASGQHDRMHILVEKASKYNFFVLFALSSPVLIYTEKLLQLWLTIPPIHAEIFLQLTLVLSLIDSLALPMMTSVQATGNIRKYQTVIGGILLLNVPVALLSLKIWPNPSLIVWTGIVLAAIALVARLLILQRLTGMPVDRYIRSVLFRVIVVSVTASFINYYFALKVSSRLDLIGGLIICFVNSIFVALIFGTDKKEKHYLKTLIFKKFRGILNVKSV